MSNQEVIPTAEFISHILKPETKLEEQIINDPDFIDGAVFGKPRSGHPEGAVVFHIREVLDNVDRYASKPVFLTKWQCEKAVRERSALRLISFIHDTFKHKVNPKQSASGENHHAMIARRFAEKYISDLAVLDIIELHDEAYNAWCNGSRDGKWEKAETRISKLLDRLGDNLTLYNIFYKSDNMTGDKSQDNYIWFQNYIK
jgi:hypothetical protein